MNERTNVFRQFACSVQSCKISLNDENAIALCNLLCLHVIYVVRDNFVVAIYCERLNILVHTHTTHIGF